jgi:hypothetical protein
VRCTKTVNCYMLQALEAYTRGVTGGGFLDIFQGNNGKAGIRQVRVGTPVRVLFGVAGRLNVGWNANCPKFLGLFDNRLDLLDCFSSIALGGSSLYHGACSYERS